MSNRHLRQSFLGVDSERRIARANVTIIGLCGGGSHVAQQLAHIGIGGLNLVDFDHAEDHNINRMVGLTMTAAHRHDLKVDCLSGLVAGVNPEAKIRAFPDKWEIVAPNLKHSTAIFGCVDSYRVREEIERFARRYLIPYIDIGMDVHGDHGNYHVSGQVILSLPGYPCLRCFGFINDELLTLEAQQYGSAGGRPQVVWPNGTLASTAVAKFMQLLNPWSKGLEPSLYTEYDGNRLQMRESHRITALGDRPCPHYTSSAGSIGDANW